MAGPVVFALMPLPQLFDANLARSTLLAAAPLIVAGVGELGVERAGMVNIGIEGMMLAGALGAWIGSGMWGLAAGFGLAMVCGMVLAVVFAVAVLRFHADQIVTGTGVNLLALGLTGMAYRWAQEAMSQRVIPAISQQTLAWAATAVAVGLAAVIWAFFRYTRAGLELAAIGEAPEAADTAGVRVRRRKLYAILFGGACAGLAGSYLSTLRVQAFTENMTQGQGFLALAIVIFGRWNGFGIVLSAVFFELVIGIADRFIMHGGVQGQTTELLKMLPYLLSLLALAGVAGRSAAPEGLGKVYLRE